MLLGAHPVGYLDSSSSGFLEHNNHSHPGQPTGERPHDPILDLLQGRETGTRYVTSIAEAAGQRIKQKSKLLCMHQPAGLQ